MAERPLKMLPSAKDRGWMIESLADLDEIPVTAAWMAESEWGIIAPSLRLWSGRA